MPNYRISYQLYSARKFPPIETHIEALAAIGYDAVEPYGGAFGTDPAGFRKKLDAAGLACPSAHISLADIDASRSAVIDTARTLGLEVVIVPAIPGDQRSKDVDGWKALAAKLTEHAAGFAEAGLKFAWHNHNFEYVRLSDGSRPIDHLIGAAGVLWEPDIGWIVRADADPKAEIAASSDQVISFHMKDVRKDDSNEEDGWADVGHGAIDWQGLWPVISGTGADLLVVEHDNPSDWRRSAERSYAHVAKLAGRGGA